MPEDKTPPARTSSSDLPGQEPEDEDYDDYGTTVFDYLQTPQGHELAKRAVDVLDRLADAKITRDAKSLGFEKGLQLVIVITVVGASSILAVMDKFTSTIGVLFGALIGYIFGRRAR